MTTLLFSLLILVLIIVLLFIAKEDFQKRTIHIGWLVGLGIFGSIYGWYFGVVPLNFLSICINIGFIVIQLLLLSLYFSIKNRQWVNIADTLLGWGDIILFFLICLMLPPLQFIWFYTLSLLAVLVGFLIYKGIRQPVEETIPLAGGMSLCLIIYLVHHLF